MIPSRLRGPVGAPVLVYQSTVRGLCRCLAAAAAPGHELKARQWPSRNRGEPPISTLAALALLRSYREAKAHAVGPTELNRECDVARCAALPEAESNPQTLWKGVESKAAGNG